MGSTRLSIRGLHRANGSLIGSALLNQGKRGEIGLFNFKAIEFKYITFFPLIVTTLGGKNNGCNGKQ